MHINLTEYNIINLPRSGRYANPGMQRVKQFHSLYTQHTAAGTQQTSADFPGAPELLD